MKDSILKGTGNSRFLKSAIPDGTTWAEALAMLRAGTFPMDLNGINNAGFQQVGTPLNKANLLKDVNALTLGLTGDATPDDMFNVLAHAGDLHVWKKTVVTAQEIPAGYNLVPVDMKTTTFMYLGDHKSSSSSPELYYGESATVNSDGSVSVSAVGKLRGQIGWTTTSDAVVMKLLPSDTDGSVAIKSNSELQALLRGKFVYFIENKNSWAAPSYLSSDKFYQIPLNATITFRSGYSTEGNSSVIISISSVNEVVGYPLTPAGTTVTYPVSTNRNAYQEGSDAKPAGYTLGEVVTGDYRFVNDSSATVTIYYADAPSVSDDGLTVDIAKTNGIAMRAAYSVSNIEAIKGKYIQIADGQKDYAGTPFNDGRVYYIPSNATFSMSSGLYAATDRYQPVTGYASIPANTTIEYLGCLGEKTRMQVVSYVGTGTYGIDNPTNITADFKMKFLLIYDFGGSSSAPGTKDSAPRAYAVEELKTEYTNYWGYVFQGGSYAKRSADGKTVSFYGWSADSQGNNSGYRYFAIAIG